MGGAQRAGETVEADRGHLGPGQSADQIRVEQGGQQPDQDLTRTQQAGVGPRGWVHADNDVGLFEDLTPGEKAGAGRGVVGIGEPGPIAGTGLDDHLMVGREQSGCAVGAQRDAPFPGRRLGDGAHCACAHLIDSRRCVADRIRVTGADMSALTALASHGCGLVHPTKRPSRRGG